MSSAICFILDQSKISSGTDLIKAGYQENIKNFANNKLKVSQMAEFLSDWIEKNVGKGENAAHQHFLPFPHCFQKTSFPAFLKPEIVWPMVESYHFTLY